METALSAGVATWRPRIARLGVPGNPAPAEDSLQARVSQWWPLQDTCSVAKTLSIGKFGGSNP